MRQKNRWDNWGREKKERKKSDQKWKEGGGMELCRAIEICNPLDAINQKIYETTYGERMDL